MAYQPVEFQPENFSETGGLLSALQQFSAGQQESHKRHTSCYHGRILKQPAPAEAMCNLWIRLLAAWFRLAQAS